MNVGEHVEQVKIQVDVIKSTLAAIHTAMEVGVIDIGEYTDAVYGVYMMARTIQESLICAMEKER